MDRGPGPKPCTESFSGSAAPPAPQPCRLHCGTPPPPPAAVLCTAAVGDSRRDPPCSLDPGPGSSGYRRLRGAGLPGRRWLLRSVPSAMRAAVPVLGGARRRSAGLVSCSGGFGASVQGSADAAAPPPARPPSLSLRAPAPARTSAASLSGTRVALASAQAGLVSPRSRGRCGTQRGEGRCGREPEASLFAAPQQGHGLGLGRRRPPLGPTSASQFAACSAPPPHQQQPGRMRVRDAPVQPAPAGGARRGGAGD